MIYMYIQFCTVFMCNFLMKPVLAEHDSHETNLNTMALIILIITVFYNHFVTIFRTFIFQNSNHFLNCLDVIHIKRRSCRLRIQFPTMT